MYQQRAKARCGNICGGRDRSFVSHRQDLILAAATGLQLPRVRSAGAGVGVGVGVGVGCGWRWRVSANHPASGCSNVRDGTCAIVIPHQGAPAFPLLDGGCIHPPCITGGTSSVMYQGTAAQPCSKPGTRLPAREALACESTTQTSDDALNWRHFPVPSQAKPHKQQTSTY